MRLTTRLPTIALALGVVLTATFGCAQSDPITDDGQISGFGGEGGGEEATSATTGASGGATSGSGHSGATTGAATTGSGTGSATTGASSTGAGPTGGGEECVDTGDGEPGNDAEGGAVDLGTIDDCNWNGSALIGTLGGGDEADWYVYYGDDVAGCNVEPQRSVSMGVRLCKFFECASGDVEFTCPDGTVDATSPEGRGGCCAEPGKSIQMGDLNCAWNIDDDVLVYMRVDNPGALDCPDYGIDFHY